MRECLGSRENGTGPFKYLTYKEVHRRAHAFGSGLLSKLHMHSGQETMVGIYGRNSVEWSLTDLACQYFSMPTVPLYDTLGKEAQVFIVNQAKLEAVVCDNLQHVESLLKESEKFLALEHLIVVNDEITQELRQMAETAKITLHTFEEIESHGEKNLAQAKVSKQCFYFSLTS